MRPLLGLLTVAISCTVAPSAFAFNELFLKDGPMSHLKKDDIEQARVAIRTALESNRDHEMSTWSNPATNASGTAMPTRTFVSKGMRCRAMTFTMVAGGEAGGSKWNLCKTQTGWKIMQ